MDIPGLAEHATGLKSLPDATALRNQVLTCMDVAESLEDNAKRAEYLGFVFAEAVTPDEVEKALTTASQRLRPVIG